MSIVHLATRRGALCHLAGPRSTTSSHLAAVTCVRCSAMFDRVVGTEAEASAQRRYEARNLEAAEQAGLADIWSYLSGDDHATRLLRSIVGSLAVALVEMGYHADRQEAAA